MLYATLATKEATWLETARAKEEGLLETDTTESLGLQEEIEMTEGGPLAPQEITGGTIEMTGDTEIETVETTDLVMIEETGEEMSPEMTGIGEEMTHGTEEEVIEMSLEEEAIQEVELIPEAEATPEAEVTPEVEEIDTAEMIATEEVGLDLEMTEETIDQRAETLRDALREDLLAHTRAEMRSLHTGPIMMIRSPKDADHPHTEGTLTISIKSLRKHKRRSKMARLRKQTSFDSQLFNQIMLQIF